MIFFNRRDKSKPARPSSTDPFRPTLSVVTAVHERGGLTAAALDVVRPYADEIIVAFDSRIARDQLGPLEAIADVLVGFEFSGRNRFRPWLREQARGEWLLLLDGDEVPSAELLRLLPVLTANKDVSGYFIPCWWAYPDSRSRLDCPPWNEDWHLRLVRNDGHLWFPGTEHSQAGTDLPTRYVDAPFIHLNLIVSTESERREKVDRNNLRFPQFTLDGRLINDTYYLPERDKSVVTTAMPAPDAEHVARVLARQQKTGLPQRELPITSAADVERWWTARPIIDLDLRGSITVSKWDETLPAQIATTLFVEIENLGESIWPASSMSRSGPQIYASYHWKHRDGSMAIWEGQRNQLTSRVLPKQRVLMTVTIRTPPDPGEYLLCLDLVHEGYGWFGIDKELAVNIEPSLRDQLCASEPDLISVSSARAVRRRLRQADGLADAMRSEKSVRPAPSQDLTFGGWSLDEDAVDYILGRIRNEKLFRVLEFGSGVSTVAIAGELAFIGGFILSVDDSPAYADQTRQMLADRGLATHASVIIANLVPTAAGGVRTLCYDFSPDLERAIKEFDPDLVVIDGPSQAANASRLAVAPLAAKLVQRPTPFVMDDAFRDAELEIGHRWQNDPQIHVSGIAAIGKGMLVGRLHGSEPGV